MSGKTSEIMLADIWARSPLDGDAIGRVFAAPLPFKAVASTDGLEIWRTAFAIFSYDALLTFLHARRSTMKERKAVVTAYTKLVAALDVLKFTTDEYPEIPASFDVEMQNWVEQAFVQARQPQHRPAAEELHNVYALLLAIYETLFQRKASGSVGGPTFRFVSAFLSEMHDALQSAQWAKLPNTTEQAPDFRRLFLQPPQETLRSRIADALQRCRSPKVGETLLGWLTTSATAGRPPLSVEQTGDLRRKLEMMIIEKQ